MLNGLNVVIFESRHAKTMAELVRLQGGNPIVAPSMQEIPLENNTEALAFGEKLLAGQWDGVILLTGVGTRSLVTVLETRFERDKILEALRKTMLVPRGPKPIRVLNEWKIPFALTVPEPNTWREILETLDSVKDKSPLKGKKIAVQEYGVSNLELLEGLKDRGAFVTQVPVYRWALPDDLDPLKKAIQLIANHQADVAMFTTGVQIEHVLKVAESLHLADAVKKAFSKMVVASVGPDCTQNLKSFGVVPDIEPESPKMGPLVVETAEKASNILKGKK